MEGVAIGRIVHYFHPRYTRPRAAIIVEDWGDGGGDAGRVNLRVFLDGTNDSLENNHATSWETSVVHKSAAAEQHAAHYWDWPARA